MESIVVALITGVVTLAGVLSSNSKSRALLEAKVDALAKQVEKHNRMVERTFGLERDMAVAKNDIAALKGRASEKDKR